MGGSVDYGRASAKDLISSELYVQQSLYRLQRGNHVDAIRFRPYLDNAQPGLEWARANFDLLCV